MVSGLDVQSGDEAARKLGLRILAPNRPGVGGSSFRPDASVLAWAEDVQEMIRGLRLEGDCGIHGWSMGGQYALALAAKLPRVRSAVIIAGALPLDVSGRLEELHWTDRWATRVSLQRPRLARRLSAVGKWLVPRWADFLILFYAALLGPEERAWARSADRAGLARAVAEALNDPAGPVEECRTWAKPWEFDLHEVQCPVTIVHGENDRLVPFRWGEKLAARLPRAELQAVPSVGHLWTVSDWERGLKAFGKMG